MPDETTPSSPITPVVLPSLEKLVSNKSLTTWIEWRDGLILNVKFVHKSVLGDMTRKHTYYRYDAAKRQRVADVNYQAMMEQFALEAVIGWKGATLRALSNLIPLDLTGVSEEQMDVEIPFSAKDLKVVRTHCFDLDTFLQDVCTDPKAFNPTHADELGNSEPSQSGS